MSKQGLLAGLSLLALTSAAGTALAQSAPPTPAPELVVTADRVGLIETKPSSAVFGIDLSLLETPRAATFVSQTTMERYGITTIDNLVEISPSSYTASFYGVPGSLNVRGTLAEDYFDGFKRVENRGTYATPIGDASELQIVRGPPNPIFGAGKVGGLLNFIPKTAKDTGAYLLSPTGEISVTAGSYDKKDFTAQGGAPVAIGAAQGGVYAYIDVDDSHSYYHGIYPKRQTGEISADFNLPGGWTTAVEAMVYHSDGDVQTPGWNRLTQNLINNGTYTTGRNATLVDVNGDGKLSAGEVFPYYYPYSGFYNQLTQCFYYGYGAPGCTNAAHQLTTGVGTAHLSPQTVFVSSADFSNTTTYTSYANLAKKLNDASSIKLEMFYDALENKRFVSYGFPASYQTYITETRATYNVASSFMDDLITTKSFVGASYRYTNAHLRESYNSGIIAPDRRDLVEGPSATDIIASPFETIDGQPGWPWDLDVHSNIRDAGVFFTSDITLAKHLNVLVGARQDNYSVSSSDGGALPYETTSAAGNKSKGTYTISVSYKTDWGLVPYYTYDQAAALELDQASDLLPGTIASGAFVSDSYLSEAGVKFQELNSTLVGSLAAYRQTRTQLVQGGPGTPASIEGTRSTGVELEIRYIATKNISFTYAGNIQHTEVKGPDGALVYTTPATAGTAGVNGYGAAYATPLDTLPGFAGDYSDAIIPHSVNSFYATYTSDPYEWGRFGATMGGAHVSKTSMLVQNPVVYPDYWLATLSGFYQFGPYTASVNINNLFDARYFTPNADPTYANVAALPGVGREWRLTLKRKF